MSVGPVLPGAAIGFFGGGQLGRMTGLAARAMGYDVRVLDPDRDCPARAVASHTVTAALDDAAAASEMARGCGVVTLEIERVGVNAIAAAERHAPVRPGAAPVHVIQDRARQKQWLAAGGFPVGDFRVCGDAAALEDAVRAMGPAIAKTTSGGYDGRGQARVETPADAAAAWAALGAPRLVAEQRLVLEREVSVMVARSPDGAMLAFPPAMNHHESGVLAWSVIPAPLDPALLLRAAEIGRALAEALDLVGLLAVELFLTGDGRLLVNELAPRPHNSFHGSERACATGQFEQLVRAVCGLPLGAVDVLQPAAILNLLGDRWAAGEPRWADAMAVSTVRPHLYGKREARAGRKMGHLSAVGATADEALARVLEAGARLAPGAPA